LINFWV